MSFTSTNDVIVDLKEVEFTYSGCKVPSLKRVNLKIRRKEITLLTGPSGCGKTTLCRVLTGLIPNFYPGDLKGEISIFGMDPRRNSIKDILRNVGMVLQNPETQIVMTTVFREIAFGLENQRVPPKIIRNRVLDMLKTLRMEDLLHENVYKLSFGQKQKVAIASILILRPKLLILDEPTSYLSPLATLELIKLLRELHEKEGVTILIVEHKFDLLAEHVTRIIVMKNGTIVSDGTPKEVLSKDLSKLYGVNMPSLAKFYHKLRKRGYKMESVPLTVREATEILRKEMREQ